MGDPESTSTLWDVLVITVICVTGIVGGAWFIDKVDRWTRSLRLPMPTAWMQGRFCRTANPCDDHWLCYSPSRCFARVATEAWNEGAARVKAGMQDG